MTEKETKHSDPKEEKHEKSEGENPSNLNAMSALGYIIFFIPMLTHRDNDYAMFHANQGLILFITAIIINIVGTVIPILGWFIILPLGWIFVLILAVLGIVNAVNGKQKKLPLIGGFEIIK